MQIRTIAGALDPIRQAGALAQEGQREMAFDERTYKADGSVLTRVDTAVEEYLYKEISRLYPGANIITEETARSFDPAKPYTFTIDPIDGTDVFSQGMPSWCVCLGLLDENLVPIAGIVFSPRWDLLVFADVGKQATCNGRECMLSDSAEPLSERSNVAMASSIHKLVDLTRLPGKTRSVGSAALHLCFPVAYKAVAGAILHPKTHIWDIAAAHAINLSHGWDLEYLSGDKIDYAALIDGSQAADIILAGPEWVIEEFRATLTRL